MSEDDANDISVHFKNTKLETTTKKVESYKSPKKLTNKDDNMISMAVIGLQEFRFKPYIFLFFLFLILTCDMFIDKGLSSFSGAVSGEDVTTYGTVLQGTFLVIFFIIIDHVCKNDYI